MKKEPRKLLVEILSWRLRSNHYHLLVRQLRNNGIVRFMRKLGTGYTMYLNRKEERVGSLFQGRFKAVIIKNEKHFMYLPFYIHYNALDLIEPEWRNGKINDFEKAMKFLKNYRFSSCLDCMGEKNFPSVSQRKSILDVFGGTENYKKQQTDWLKQMTKKTIEELDGFLLE